MSNKLFSKSEVELLNSNIYVKKVSNKSITYADEFKLLFINKYYEGEAATDIFKESGFDIDVVGSKRIKECSSRWRKQFKRKEGLIDTRKNNMGRPKFNSLSNVDNIDYLKAKIEYLEQENDFLKKLQRLERMMQKK